MEWIIAIIVIGLVLYTKFFSGGKKDKFWKMVVKYPNDAYVFFSMHDCWYVIHPWDSEKKPTNGYWTGPFRVDVPGVGVIKVYGKMPEMEEKQVEFSRQKEKQEESIRQRDN